MLHPRLAPPTPLPPTRAQELGRVPVQLCIPSQAFPTTLNLFFFLNQGQIRELRKMDMGVAGGPREGGVSGPTGLKAAQLASL